MYVIFKAYLLNWINKIIFKLLSIKQFITILDTSASLASASAA